MRLPVLESIISGECYDRFGRLYDLNYFHKKTAHSTFDWENPFNFNSLNGVFSESIKKRAFMHVDVGGGIPAFKFGKYPFWIKGRVKGLVDLCEGSYSEEFIVIGDELELLCNQFHSFNLDYADDELFERMIIEFFDYILEMSRRYRGKREEKIILYKWVVFFYGFYFEIIHPWAEYSHGLCHSTLGNNTRRLMDIMYDAKMDFGGEFDEYLSATRFDKMYLIKQEECNDELLDEEYSRFVENAESLGKCLNNVESVVKVDDVDRKIAVAKQKLVFLNNQNFLNDGYYELLIGWIEELIREGKCPTDVLKIQKPKKVAVEWITYTISLIYDELFENTTEIDSQWIEFVKKLKCINVKDETQTEEKRWIDAQNKFRQRPLIPTKCRKNIDKEERDRWFYDDVVLGKRMLNGKERKL